MTPSPSIEAIAATTASAALPLHDMRSVHFRVKEMEREEDRQREREKEREREREREMDKR